MGLYSNIMFAHLAFAAILHKKNVNQVPRLPAMAKHGQRIASHLKFNPATLYCPRIFVKIAVLLTDKINVDHKKEKCRNMKALV